MATAVITDIRNVTKSIARSDYGIAKITDIKSNKTVINQTLPFRIKFINIGITNQYNPESPAPIGIAVIGINNYIL